MANSCIKYLISLIAVSGIYWPGAICYCQSDALRAKDFTVCFGDTTVVNNSAGVTLTRTKSGEDAGCEFHPNGGNISLDADHSRIELKPKESVNSGYYVVTITYKNEYGKWNEKDWIRDTGQRDTNLQVLSDVRKFASDNGIRGMTEYFIKVRVQPWKFEGLKKPAFIFSRLSIKPVR
jgi:hypothetical protein